MRVEVIMDIDLCAYYTYFIGKYCKTPRKR